MLKNCDLQFCDDDSLIAFIVFRISINEDDNLFSRDIVKFHLHTSCSVINVDHTVTINSIRFDIVFKAYLSCTSITSYLKSFMTTAASSSSFNKVFVACSLSKSELENIDINDLRERDNELSIAEDWTSSFSTSWFSLSDWVEERDSRIFLTIWRDVSIKFSLSIFSIVLMISFDVDIALCLLNRCSFSKFE